MNEINCNSDTLERVCFCSSCGGGVSNKDKFCHQCGHALGQDSKKNEKEVVSKIPASIATGALLIAAFGGIQDYNFFEFLRWIITGVSLFYAYKIYKQDNTWSGHVVLFIGLALLFNPISPVYLYRELWQKIDIIAAIAYGIFLVSKTK